MEQEASSFKQKNQEIGFPSSYDNIYPSSHFEMIPFIEPPTYLEFEDNYMNHLRRHSMAEQSYSQDSYPNYPGMNFSLEGDLINNTDPNENHLSNLTDIRNKFQAACFNQSYSSFNYRDDRYNEVLNSTNFNPKSSNTSLYSRRKSVPAIPVTSKGKFITRKMNQDPKYLKRKLSNCTAALKSRQRKADWVDETTINLNRLRKENRLLYGQIEWLQKESFLIHSILSTSCPNGLGTFQNQYPIPSELQCLSARKFEFDTPSENSSELPDPPKAIVLNSCGSTSPAKESNVQQEETDVSFFKLTSQPLNP